MPRRARYSSWSAWWWSGSLASSYASGSRSTSSCGRARGCRKSASTSGASTSGSAKPADLRGRGEPAVDRLDLPAGVLTAPAVVDHQVGPGALLVQRHLGGDPLSSFFVGHPVTLDEPSQLCLGVDPDDDHALDGAGAVVLVEQRDVDDQQARP